MFERNNCCLCTISTLLGIINYHIISMLYSKWYFVCLCIISARQVQISVSFPHFLNGKVWALHHFGSSSKFKLTYHSQAVFERKICVACSHLTCPLQFWIIIYFVHVVVSSNQLSIWIKVTCNSEVIIHMQYQNYPYGIVAYILFQ